MDSSALEMLDGLVADFRRQGALGWLPYALETLALAQKFTGRLRDAAAAGDAATRVLGDSRPA